MADKKSLHGDGAWNIVINFKLPDTCYPSAVFWEASGLIVLLGVLDMISQWVHGLACSMVPHLGFMKVLPWTLSLLIPCILPCVFTCILSWFF